MERKREEDDADVNGDGVNNIFRNLLQKNFFSSCNLILHAYLDTKQEMSGFRILFIRFKPKN